mmetsp:Transcript_58356/g.94335  ORF Transcript_58356/g.94335 Transcript_58356/m.94335 type:complete len:212 (-) Transcript_58356:152-787(-)
MSSISFISRSVASRSRSAATSSFSDSHRDCRVVISCCASPSCLRSASLSSSTAESFWAKSCRRLAISSCSTRIIFAFLSSFMTTLLTIFLHLEAYLNVLTVSMLSTSLGLMVATIMVLEFPPRLSFRSHVSFVSRYGMCSFWPASMSASLAMTFPSAERDLLIFTASLSSLPSTPDLFTRSLPAKSTKLTQLVFCDDTTSLPVSSSMNVRD